MSQGVVYLRQALYGVLVIASYSYWSHTLRLQGRERRGEGIITLELCVGSATYEYA